MVIILGYFFLFLHKNICCGYSLEAPHRGTSNVYPQHMFLWKIRENYPRIITKYSLPTPLLSNRQIPLLLITQFLYYPTPKDFAFIPAIYESRRTRTISSHKKKKHKERNIKFQSP